MSWIPKQLNGECPDWYYEAGALWWFATKRYTVALFALPEDMPPEDSFTDKRDIAYANEAYGERGWGLSGNPAHWFCAVVGVYGPDGKLLGWDSLGGCSYGSFEEFYSAHRWQYSRSQRKWITDPRSRAWKACEARRPRREDGSRTDGHYFPQMVREAISHARQNLAKCRDGMVGAA